MHDATPTRRREASGRPRPTAGVRAALDHLAWRGRGGLRGPDADAAATTEPTEDLRDLVRASLSPNPTGPPRPVTSARIGLLGGPRLRAGLSFECELFEPDGEEWLTALTEDGADLLLVEVHGDVVAGSPAPRQASDVTRAATGSGLPVVAWVTAGCSLASGESLREAGAVVFCVEPDCAAGHRTLPPATQPRLQSPVHLPGAVRPGSVVTLSAAGPEAEALSARHADGVVQDWGPDPELPEPLDNIPLLSRFHVLADIGARDTDDTGVVLDALASRTAVVTDLHRAAALPPELREVVHAVEPDTLHRQVSALAQQAEYRDRSTQRALRSVLHGHTYADRARTIAQAVDLPHRTEDRTVSVVVPTNRTHELDNIVDNVARQQGTSTELVLVAHGIEVDEARLRSQARELGLDQVTVRQVDSSRTLGAVLNAGLDAASGAYVAKMDDDNYYGPHFLADLVDASVHTGAEITGKWAHYVWLRSSGAVVLRFENYENAFHRLVQGGSIVATREVALDLRFSDIPRAVDSDFLNRAMAAGVRTYSGDRFNFVSIRGTDRRGHTWKVDDLVFLTGAGRVVTYGDPRELVSV